MTLTISQSDLFISIGTSGNVYPAAGFVETAKRYGPATVIVPEYLSQFN